MFNPLKGLGDLNQMRKQAKAIQGALEKEEFEAKVGDVLVVISGNQTIKRIEIDGEENSDVRRAVNEAVKRSQQAAAKKLMEMTKEGS